MGRAERRKSISCQNSPAPHLPLTQPLLKWAWLLRWDGLGALLSTASVAPRRASAAFWAEQGNDLSDGKNGCQLQAELPPQNTQHCLFTWRFTVSLQSPQRFLIWRVLFLLFSVIPVQMPRHSLTLRVVEFVPKESLESERQGYRLWNWFWKCYQTKPGSACPCSTANLLTSGCGGGKCSIHWEVSDKGSRIATV